MRHRDEPWSGARPSFCSNDYLGLAGADVHLTGRGGASASRLVTGEHAAHRDLERALASWLGTQGALVFSSGYAANVGVVSALARQGDLIVSDALNHASIIDGARLSRARVEVTPHGDLDAVESALRGRTEARAVVVFESYYSMDADSPDLARLRRIADATHATLILDEAHALGVFGPTGRGLCADAKVVPDALVGTLGKAVGTQGGFVAGDSDLVKWLWNRARSFVFSTGLSPILASLARRNIESLQRAGEDRGRVSTMAARLRAGLAPLRLDVRGYGHVVPVVLGSARRAVAMAAALRERGFDVQAIRPPTVPNGSSRLRLSISASHTHEDIDALLVAIADVSRDTL